MKKTVFPVGVYVLKVNNRSTKTRCEICSKLTINTKTTPMASYFTTFSSVSIVNFEHVIANWFTFNPLNFKSFNHLIL